MIWTLLDDMDVLDILFYARYRRSMHSLYEHLDDDDSLAGYPPQLLPIATMILSPPLSPHPPPLLIFL